MNKIQLTNEEIIKGYVALCYTLGRVANLRDIDNCDELPHSTTIRSRFGSMPEFQKLSGIIQNNELSGKLLKSEVEKILIQKRVQRGRRLDYLEVAADQDLPRVNYVRRVYNNKSLDEIWDEVEGRIPKGIADYLGI